MIGPTLDRSAIKATSVVGDKTTTDFDDPALVAAHDAVLGRDGLKARILRINRTLLLIKLRLQML